MNHELGTLADIAKLTGGHVIGDQSRQITKIAAIDESDAGTLTFATDERYFQAALASRAAAILAVDTIVDPAATYDKPVVAVASPRIALSSLLATLATPRVRGPYVDPTASIDPSATIREDVYVGRNVSIGAGAVIGARTVLSTDCTIGRDVTVGEDGYLDTRAYVGDGTLIGNRVTIKPHAVIGSEGFGWAFLDGALRKIPQIGIVELGDDVEIGASTCVDRAQTGVTSIGDGTKIDNLVQIGHNCRIGKHCAIAGQCGLAGSTIVGDYVQMGGQVGVKGHLTIGSRVRIAARAEVWGDIADDQTVSGAPARSHRETLRAQASARKVPELIKRVAELTNAIQKR